MEKIYLEALVLDKFFSSAKLMQLDEISKLISFPEYYKVMKEVDELLKNEEVINFVFKNLEQALRIVSNDK